MKDEILQILKEEVSIEQSGYMNGYADLVGVSDAAEAIAQLMCDQMARALMSYIDGKNWENEMIMQLENYGFTKDQIINSLNKTK